MLLHTLREEVLEANIELFHRGLALYTFGNASAISREQGLVAIKPSGVPYDSITAGDIVITDLNGKLVDGRLNPSSDLSTHLEIYRHFSNVGGVVHTHSEFATAWAQARKPIPCLGTTHADYFHDAVPVTDELSEAEIRADYEKNTGLAICRAFGDVSSEDVPSVLVAGHGPFSWGNSAADAVHNAVILEYVAKVAYRTIGINHAPECISRELHDKHYLRKHGRAAYYGQAKG